MSPASLVRLTGEGRFPRVSGDEPVTIAGDSSDLAFSPRERG